MALSSVANLDVPILAVLHDRLHTGTWLTSSEVGAGLAEHDLPEVPCEQVLQRLVLLLADNMVECRARGEDLVWRSAHATRRDSSNADTWLTEDEALALQAMKRFSQRQITTCLAMRAEKMLATAENRLRRGGRDGVPRRIAWHSKVAIVDRISPLILPRLRESIVNAVLDSVFDERFLQVLYRPRSGPDRSRVLGPLGVVEKLGLVYLIAIEGDEPDPVCLRLDRFQSATVLPRPFPYPENFCLTDYVADVGDFGLRSEGHVKLALRFPRGQNHLVRDAPLSGDQDEEIRPDGSVVIRCTCDVNDRLLRWLLSQGASVEVLEPLALRRMFAHEAKLLLHLYCRR